MSQETIIQFFTKLARNANLHVYRFSSGAIPQFDQGLRKLLGVRQPDLQDFIDRLQEKTIYMVENMFCWRYLGLRLPKSDQILAIGPYLSENMSDQMIMSIMEDIHLPPVHLNTLRRFYHSVPVVPSESTLFVAVNTLGEMLFGGPDAFSTEFISHQVAPELFTTPDSMSSAIADHPDMELLEQRYAYESELLYAIAHGQIHRASTILSAFHPQQVEQRSANPLRNTKNYAIVSNTLMRKAVQQAGVHPYYIDQLSSIIARRIEQAITVEETQKLLFSMAHKYCLLVKNHNLNEYSQPVQRVILRTDMEISGDLSLRAHAEHLGVNASYLSSLFKKETGVTLTEYVNARRVDYAIFLLNSTSMQIQTIAQHCGMTDVNYFTRTFRRITGKTPTQYRQSILNAVP